MRNYHTAASEFNYLQTAEQDLHGSLDGLNACVECCDRHADGQDVALYYEAHDGRASQHTFRELQDQAARFGNFLREQGVQPGDRVAGLLPRTFELLITILGAWRVGAVYQPLFTAFGPKAIEHRLEQSGARVVITDQHNVFGFAVMLIADLADNLLKDVLQGDQALQGAEQLGASGFIAVAIE